MASKEIIVEDLGLCHYEPTWEHQKKLQKALIDGSCQEHLIFCEHYPVITYGKSTKDENLLVDRKVLQEKEIEIFQVERGGDITFHGPGQLVAYPILDLRKRRQDVGWYMRELEELVLLTLGDFEIQGFRQKNRTGVWATELSSAESDITSCKQRKIASIGVRISRWCTLHGIALNLFPQQDGFQLINPCGFQDIDISSMAEECIIQKVSKDPKELSREVVQESFLRYFQERFYTTK